KAGFPSASEDLPSSSVTAAACSAVSGAAKAEQTSGRTARAMAETAARKNVGSSFIRVAMTTAFHSLRAGLRVLCFAWLSEIESPEIRGFRALVSHCPTLNGPGGDRFRIDRIDQFGRPKTVN